MDTVFSHQDEAAMVRVAADLVNIASPTGREDPIANYVARSFADLGMHIETQEVEPGRHNVIARLKFPRPGPTLMFLAHLDVNTHSDYKPSELDVDDRSVDKFPEAATSMPVGFRNEATVEDGWIFGNGISNMKCAFAGFWSALQMLRDSQAQLCGEIVVAGVVGEIEKAPVDMWQGRAYRGGGLGARFLVHHGVTADFCINGEPTGLRLQTGNAGYLFVRIGVKGSSQGTHTKAMAIDPIPKAFRIHQALQSWETEYIARHKHPMMAPLVNVGAIHGGYPYKASLAAPFCNLYVHINLLPGQRIIDVRRDLEQLVDQLREGDKDLEASVDIYLASNGHMVEDSHPIVRAVADAHREVFGTEPERPDPARYSVSSDNSPLAEFGIPGVTYGAGGITRNGEYAGYERGIGPVGVRIENLRSCARVYAAAAMRLLHVETEA